LIRYALQCEAGHGFESWFADGAAYDTLSRSGHLSCPECGSARVSKALMAPAVRPGRAGEDAPRPISGPVPEDARGPAPVPATLPQGIAPAAPAVVAAAAGDGGPTREELETALAALRREVEANSEYVGLDFVSEARRIHDGDAPTRSIYGEANPEDARKLLEDGVRVAPLPFIPRRKAN